MRKRGTLATLALAATMLALPALALSPAPNPSPSPSPQMRGQMGSNQNIAQIEQRLNHIMNQLAHDKRDYGGHKAKAIKLLQQAQEQLSKAEQYAGAHGY